MTDKYFDKYEEEQQIYDEPIFNFISDNLERELERNNEQNSIQDINSDVKTFVKTSCLIQTFEENLNSESKNWLNETTQKIGNKDDDNDSRALGKKRMIHSNTVMII